MRCPRTMEERQLGLVSIENFSQNLINSYIRRWQRMQKQPFYSVLTNKGDSRYVAQENIQLVGGKLKTDKNSKKSLFFRKFQINEQKDRCN